MTHVAPAALLPRLPLGKLCWMPWLTYGLSGGLEGGQAVVATPYRVSAGACGGPYAGGPGVSPPRSPATSGLLCRVSEDDMAVPAAPAGRNLIPGTKAFGHTDTVADGIDHGVAKMVTFLCIILQLHQNEDEIVKWPHNCHALATVDSIL